MKYDFDLELDTRNSLSLIVKQIKANSIVLEFGPANGRLTKYLKEKLNCTVYIVEIDNEAAEDSMRYAKDGIVGDIEEYKWLEKWQNISFDFILFADVLEHLKNPEKVLSQTKYILKDDGKVILSVPNISHDSIMINLFNNIFNYTPVGLLDNTHIHLFAYNTLVEFCHFAGYYPVIEDAIYVKPEDTEIKNHYYNVDRRTAKALKNKKYGNVYQFVFTLQKKDYVAINPSVTDYRVKAHIPENTLKLYLDYGEGWSEDNCIAYKVHLFSKIQKTFALNQNDGIVGIRIDPLDVNGLFLFEKIEIENSLGTKKYELEECMCNGKIFGNYLLCKRDDPQIILPPLEINAHSKLTVQFQCYYANMEEDVVNLIDIIEQHLINNLYMQLETLSNIKKGQEAELRKCKLELEHHINEINQLTSRTDEQKNKIKLLNEELDRRAIELDHRMEEINHRDKRLDEQGNKIKLLNEELDRRVIELDHRMTEINCRDELLNKQQNKIDTLEEENKCLKNKSFSIFGRQYTSKK